MLGLPPSTEIKKQLPKTQLAAKKRLKSEDRRLLDDNVSRLDLVNQISSKTIPALAAGETVKSIFVLKASLKRKNYDPKASQLILKQIPQKLILVLSFEGESRLAVLHEKPLVSDWRSDSAWQNEASLEIRGADLDAVWISLKSQVSGIVLDDDAVCVSFQKRQPTDTKFSYELGGDITPSYSEMETAISCNDLSCYYNKDCYCKASDVKIDCDAWCETYRRK